MSKLERVLALLKTKALSPDVVAKAIEEDLRKLTNEELKRIISKAQPSLVAPRLVPDDPRPGGVPAVAPESKPFGIEGVTRRVIDSSAWMPVAPDPEEVKRIREGFDREFLGKFPPVASKKPGLGIIDDPVDAVGRGITGSFDPAAYGVYGPEWWIADPKPGSIPTLAAAGQDLDLDCEDFGFSDPEAFGTAFGLHMEQSTLGVRNIVCPLTNRRVSLTWLKQQKPHSSLASPAKTEVTLPKPYSERDIRSMVSSEMYEGDPTKT